MKNSIYNHEEQFHNEISSNEIVPIIIKLFNPENVLDIGCGLGTWLASFKKFGTKSIMGIDGIHVNKTLVWKNINDNEFKSLDLNQPFDLQKKFDMVLSLEVAEHLDKKNAELFVQNIIKHGDMILFSAAIPYQGGQNHVNEQWLDYWNAKFEAFGYIANDIIRPLIWNNPNIFWWYKQNMMVYTKNNKLNISKNFDSINIVHPELYLIKENSIIELRNFLYTTNHKVVFKDWLLFFKLFIKKTFYLLKSLI